jgi:glycosyltransferase involved in cell wall biosynthesis
MRKLALISDHASPLAPVGSIDSGGQNVYVAQLARQLGRNGWLVDVFTRRDRSFLPTVMHCAPNVRVVHVPAGPPRFVPKEELLPAMPAFGTFLGEFFERERRAQRGYDLVHANFFMSGHAARAPAQALGLPLVMTFHALGLVRRRHQSGADRFPDERFDIEAQLVREAERIVAECPQDREDLIRLYGGEPRRIETVPCGFDPEELQPMDRRAARAALGWERNEFTVLQLGRLVPRKGVDNVIRAIEVLKRRHRVQARLYVVGGNSEKPNAIATPEIGRLQQLARALGVAGQVEFVGRRGRDVLSRYYSAADVFVTTPWYEPFGITPVEAMACGAPVVGSAVGGIRSTVIDGVTGFLVPPEDPQALAERLARLHGDARLATRLGEAGRRRAFRHFTWKQIGAQIARVYARALGEDTPARRAGAELMEARL